MQNKPNEADIVLNAEEACALLGVSRPKLGRLRKAGALKGYQVWGTWVYYQSDLIAYRVASAADSPRER